MVPPDAAHWDAQEQSYKAGAAAWDGIHQQIVQDNAAFRDAADSTGFDSAHQAGAMLAEEAKTISEWHDGVAKKCNGIAVVLRETAAGQDQLVRDADAAINAAKLPGERETLVTAYHAQARTQTAMRGQVCDHQGPGPLQKDSSRKYLSINLPQEYNLSGHSNYNAVVLR